MANKIILKKSNVSSKVPLAGDLDYGELALNYADGKLFYKDSSNNIQEISGGGSGGASVSVSTTAPSSPTAGDLWWNSEEGRLKIYYNDGTSSQWVDAFVSINGVDGIGITDINLTSGNHAAGTTDVYTITYSDNTTSQFSVYNGSNGINGTNGLGWTAGSYNASTGQVTFTSTDGLGFVTGDLRANDGADGLGWTGGSYNSGTGQVTFTSTDGLGFTTGDLRGADGADGADGITMGKAIAAAIVFG